MMKYKKTTLGFSAFALLAAVLIIWNIYQSGARKAEKKKPGPLVETSKVEKRSISEILELTGEAVVTNRVTIKATVTGVVSYCPWREGDTVKAGEDLIRIERPLLIAEMEAKKAALEVAEAKLADIRAGARPEEIIRAQQEVNRLRECEIYTKSNLERNEKLFKKDIVSEETLELAKVAYAKCTSDLQAALETLKMLKEGATKTQIAVLKAQVREAEAQYKILREKVSESEIKAPFTGIVTRVFVREGDLVREGRDDVVLLEMIDPDSIVALFHVPEQYAHLIKKNGPVALSVDSLADDFFDEKIVRVYPEADEATHTVPLEASLSSENVKPGMFVRVKLPVRSAENALVVPDAALISTPDGNTVVYTVNNGVASRRLVKTGIESGRWVQIIQGVVSGEEVVVRGNEKLKDGAKVRLPGAGKGVAKGGGD